MEGIDLFVKILVFVKILSQWKRRNEEISILRSVSASSLHLKIVWKGHKVSLFWFSREANDMRFFFPKSETSEVTILNRMLHSLNKSLLSFTGLANDPFNKSTSLYGHKEQMTLLILFSTLQWLDPKNNRRNRVDFIVVFNQYQIKVGCFFGYHRSWTS